MSAAGLALAGVGGLLFGSFANVVIWRLPRNESIVKPGSRCPSCSTPLRAIDNIPVVSWLVLRARCRSCGARISARYPIIELVTAGLFVLTAWRLDRPADLVAYLPLMWVLVVLSGIDIEHKILPNRIVYPAIATGVLLLAVAAAIGGSWSDWVRALLCGVAAFGAFLLIALIYPAGMGVGDVKLAALLGMALGYLDPGGTRAFVGLFFGFLLGSVGGIALILARRGDRKSQIPFGPYMAAGAVAGILWGDAVVTLWLGP